MAESGTRGRAGAGDKAIGVRLRERRTELGISQGAVGDVLGISYQQIQKFEMGTNRISALQLWRLGGLLNVDLDYFFVYVD